MYRKGGPRKLGDYYQDLIALQLFVTYLEQPDYYEWIKLECSDGEFLDDIVAMSKDGYIVKQVKYAGYPRRDVYDWDMLLNPEDSQKKSLLKKWSDSVKKIQLQGPISEASLETNRGINEEIRAVWSADNKIRLDMIEDAELRDRIFTEVGRGEEANEFFSLFTFNFNGPSFERLEEELLARFRKRGINEDGLNKFILEVRKWVTIKNEPKPNGIITIENIREACGWHHLITIPQNFQVPEDFVIPDEEFNANFLDAIRDTETRCIVLTGSPGLGKSTYLSKIYNELVKEDIPIIRHHYYLDSKRRGESRFDHRTIKESLMYDLKINFHDKITIYNESISHKDFDKWLAQCNVYFESIDKTLIIIIDGLDHVWREKKSLDELNQLFDSFSTIQDNIKLIIGIQPLEETQVPYNLLRIAPRDIWRYLPPLTLEAVQNWIRHHQDLIIFPTDDSRNTEIINGLAQRFFERSRGHPLYLKYSLQEIIEKQLPFTEYTIRSLPSCPGDDISSYYNELLLPATENIKIMACLFVETSIIWSEEWIIACLKPMIPSDIEILKALNEIKHVLDRSSAGYSIYHDSLRTYLTDQQYTTQANLVRKYLIQWMENGAPEYLKWMYYWQLKSNAGDDNALINGPSKEWLIESFINLYDQKDISHLINYAIRASLKNKQLTRAIDLWFISDYYNSGLQYHEDISDSIFKALIRIPQEDYLVDITLERLFDKTDSQLLAIAQKYNDEIVIVENCITELDQRQHYIYGRYGSLRTNSTTRKLLQLLPLVDVDREQFLKSFTHIEARDLELARSYMRIFCLAALEYKKAKLLLDLLEMDETFNDLVLQYSVFLSFQEGFDLKPYLSSSQSNPYAMLYATLRDVAGFNYVTRDFPFAKLFNDKMNVFTLREEYPSAFYEMNYLFLANHLNDNKDANIEWIKEIESITIKSYMNKLNEITGDLSIKIKEKTEIPLIVFYDMMSDIRRPTWITHREERYYGDYIETCLYHLLYDCVIINELNGFTNKLDTKDLTGLMRYEYFDVWNFLSYYNSTEKLWITQDVISFINNILAPQINQVISPSSIRATKYSILANLHAKHQNLKNIKKWLIDSIYNIMSYRDHKDTLLFYTLDVVDVAYQMGVSVDDNLKKLIPAIIYINEYTDGDETRHLPGKLGEILIKHKIEWYVPYYQYLLENEEFRFADDVFESLVKYGNITTTPYKLLFETIIDDENIAYLGEQAKRGNSSAREILSKIKSIQGDNIIAVIDGIRNRTQVSSTRELEPLPEIDGYEPDQLDEYLDSISSYNKREGVAAWVAYWQDKEENKEVYDVFKQKMLRSDRFEHALPVFNLARKLYGKIEAYPWLVKAYSEHFGWYPHWIRDEKRRELWENVSQYYPEKWYEFLVDTLNPTFKNIEYYGLVEGVAHIVKYLIYMGKTEIAEQVALCFIENTLKVLEPLNLQMPKEIEDLE